MEREIHTLCGLPQVGTAFACDNDGNVVASAEPVMLATATMQSAGRAVAQALSVMTTPERSVDRVELVYDTWRLFARDLGPGVLVLICQPEADMPLIRMQTDIVVAAWRRDGIIARRLGAKTDGRAQLLTRANLDERAWASWSLLTTG
jgi:hypothetical protein